MSATASAAPVHIVIAGAGAAAQSLLGQLLTRRLPLNSAVTVLNNRDDCPDALLELAAHPRVSLRCGQPASHVDAGSRTVTTADGLEFSYDHLVIATDSSPALGQVPSAVLVEERTPRSDLAESAGLLTTPDGGIAVRADMSTSVPGIWAVEDVASCDGVRPGLVLPASSAAARCAAALLGEAVPGTAAA